MCALRTIGAKSPTTPSVKILFQYILVRRDLEPITQMVQIAHAVREISNLFPTQQMDHVCSQACVDNPHDETHIGLLSVANEEELVAAHERLKRKEVACYLFWEPEADLHHTAIACAPVEMTNKRRKIFYPYDKLGTDKPKELVSELK